MTRYLKQLIKGFLRKCNRKLVYVPQGTLSGIHLFEDLKLVIVKERPVCLDVGAHVGQTIDLLQRSFNKPTIYAFEPSSTMFQILQSKEFVSQVFLYNLALGKVTCKREFTNYKISTLSSLLPLDIHEENRFRNVEMVNKELVEIDTVDNFLKQNCINYVDLLKIDTQGYDLEVLLGAEEALQRGVVQNVIVELNFVRMYKDQSSAKDITDLLTSYNMSLVDYYEKERQDNAIAWCTALFSRK